MVTMMQQEKKPKVSVCIVTYNQEKYIRDCLQSVVDQKTDFDFEVLVADDCSADGTRNVVQEFANNYPDIIKPIFHAKNIGAFENYIFVHKAATGEYIAHLDGDDYWLPGKLQIQNNFLDKNKECNFVVTRMERLDRKGNFKPDKIDIRSLPLNGFTRADILALGGIGAHSTKMYRRKQQIQGYPDFRTVDLFEHVEHIGEGKAYIIGNRPYAVYREKAGMLHSQNEIVVNSICNILLFCNQKYPQLNKYINTGALFYFLADIKHTRKTWSKTLALWIKTFNPFSLILLVKYWPIKSMLSR
jgi:glycosyltransferase involved in cell wall biosynthesis